MLFYVIIIVLYCIYLASACLLNETIRINSLVHLFTCLHTIHLSWPSGPKDQMCLTKGVWQWLVLILFRHYVFLSLVLHTLSGINKYNVGKWLASQQAWDVVLRTARPLQCWSSRNTSCVRNVHHCGHQYDYKSSCYINYIITPLNWHSYYLDIFSTIIGISYIDVNNQAKIE